MINGIVTGAINPSPIWQSPVGNHLLTMRGPAYTYYEEWNHEGENVAAFQLFQPHQRVICRFVYDDHYWVKLNAFAEASDLDSPFIEIVNRIAKSYKMCSLSMRAVKMSLTSPRIVKDQLFYIQTKPEYTPVFCIFDLLNGVILRKIRTYSVGFTATLRANSHFIAWTDNTKWVKYLNLQTLIISQINLKITYGSSIHLNRIGPILTVIYQDRDTATATWRRQVFDMATGKLLQDILYDREPNSC